MTNTPKETQTNGAQGAHLYLVSPEHPEVLSLSAFYLEQRLQHPEIEHPRVRRFSDREDTPSEVRGKDLISLRVGDGIYVWGYNPSSKIPKDMEIVQGHFEYVNFGGLPGAFFQVDRNEPNSTKPKEEEMQRGQRSLYERVFNYFRHRKK